MFRVILLIAMSMINLDLSNHHETVYGQALPTSDPNSPVIFLGTSVNDTDLGNTSSGSEVSDNNSSMGANITDIGSSEVSDNNSSIGVNTTETGSSEVRDNNSSMDVNVTDTRISEVSDNNISKGGNLIDTGSISEQTYRSVQTACDLIVAPGFVFFGLIGNTLSLRTLLHQKPRNAINVYLISLSVTDMLVLILAGIDVVREIFVRSNPAVGARMRAALFLPINLFVFIVVTRMTAFLTIILSLERTIAVTLPFKVKDIFLNRHPWEIVIALYIVLTLFFVPSLFRFNLFVLEDESTGQPSVIIIPTEFSRSMPSFYTYYALAGQVLTTFLPMLVVFVCNLITVISLRTSSRNRKEMATNQKDDDKTTRLLLTISAIFLACTAPGAVNDLVVNFVPTYGFNQKEHYLFAAISVILTTPMLLNSGINFIVYMFISEHFRQSFYETWSFAYRVRRWINAV